MPGQLDLLGPSKTTPEPAAADPTWTRLAVALPQKLYLGTSSWSFPGWKGIVWRGEHSEQVLARDGLYAYARHPLLTSVGIDRTFYGPVAPSVLRAYADVVPPGFRFLVKAAEALTHRRYPQHPRYGERAGRTNPDFLSPSFAEEMVVGPFVEGLGEKGGPLVFQFPPQSEQSLGGPEGFAEQVHAFLTALPRGPLYAVEVRTPGVVTPALGDALLAAGAVPCLNVMRGMLDVDRQAALLGQDRFPALVVRWMLTADLTYEAARQAFWPFDRLKAPDPVSRDRVATLVETFTRAGRPGYVIVNNKAEGSAPLSIFRLVERLTSR